MYTVISKNEWDRKAIWIGNAWAHTTPETAVKHACDRQRFCGERHIVLYGDQKIFETP